MLEQELNELVETKQREGVPDFVIKNFVKEYLQYPVLECVYTTPDYQPWVFYGGSCLRVCFQAPRLSEDLDFELTQKDFGALDLPRIAAAIKERLTRDRGLSLETKIQSRSRIYLKFPMLHRLRLATREESDFLFVKLEFSVSPSSTASTELTPVSQFGYNFIVRHYPLPRLFAGKIAALLTRVWFKGKGDEVDIKGRDFYDLYWYLERGVEPDWDFLAKHVKISNRRELNRVLRERIWRAVTHQKLSYDLKNFFPDQRFVEDFCLNYKEIMKKYLD